MMDKFVYAGVTFTRLAAFNIDESEVDVERDFDRLREGSIDADDLLAECLEGADEDRLEGWHDYVTTLTRAVEADAEAAQCLRDGEGV